MKQSQYLELPRMDSKHRSKIDMQEKQDKVHIKNDEYCVLEKLTQFQCNYEATEIICKSFYRYFRNCGPGKREELN